jgi:hypothetical protein
MEGTLSGVQTSMNSVVAPRELLMVTTRYAASMVFYTDGSFIDRCAGFAFHRTEEGGFGYKISSSAGIFTEELTALFASLRHIGNVIQHPILTDSLNSVKVLLFRKVSHRNHPLAYECKQMFSEKDGVEVVLKDHFHR